MGCSWVVLPIRFCLQLFRVISSFAFYWENHCWSKTNKIRFLSKHILFFRVVRCSQESPHRTVFITVTTIPCWWSEIWRSMIFCALIALQRHLCSLTHAFTFRSALTCSENIQRRSSNSCRSFSKSNWIAQTLSNWECCPIGWFLIFVWVRQHVREIWLSKL